MTTHAISFDAELADLKADAWMERVQEIGEAIGKFTPLGDDHAAVFLDAGPKLLVSFEDAHSLRQNAKGAEPRSFAHTRRDGWSTMTILSKRTSWYRDDAIYHYFDDLIDEGFFDAYEQVLFYGQGPCGYAAAAYSVAAPGARVLALNPQATLNARLAAFDPRARAVKRVDFTSRFGYAPDMLEAADQAYVVYDINRRPESIHASMFARKNVTLLRAFGIGHLLDQAFYDLDILEDLFHAAMAGSLNTHVFADQLRARRESASYLVWLISRAKDAGHLKLAAKASAVAIKLVDEDDLMKLHNAIAAQSNAPSTEAAE